jgi:hypothetical protein
LKKRRTTIVRPAEHAKWFNKFFPTDPWSDDTDADTVKDGAEFSKFVYGDPADDGSLVSIPGGGMNPLSIDTDHDGLPDAWEAQYAGKTMYSGENGDKAKVAGAEVGNYLQGLVDGMDGTVQDAFNTPAIKEFNEASGSNRLVTVIKSGVHQVVNRDYDNDGLDNWQEYLTGTMRSWRYDDPLSSFTSIPYDMYWSTDSVTGDIVWDPKFEQLGVSDEGEFWYRTLVDARVDNPLYNPTLVTDVNPGSQYFTPVTLKWDPAYRDYNLDKAHPVAYYHLYDRIGSGMLIKDAWGHMKAPTKYIGCSPIKADTDQDGMDDGYELFHGMNPLLGQAKHLVESDGPCDIVYDGWYNKSESSSPVDAFENTWKTAADKFDSTIASLYALTVPYGATVTVKVYRTPNLAENWTLASTQTVVISLSGTEIRAPLATDVDLKSGFFKVEVEQ